MDHCWSELLYAIEVEKKFSNKSEMINADKSSVWVVPDGIGSI